MEGPIGTIIDVLSVFATVVGVAVSLSMGALQINGGLLIYLVFQIMYGFNLL